MRSLWKVPALLLACAGLAYAQAVVTLRGAVSSLDSTRANVVITTNGRDQLIVLPTTVKVHWASPDGAALTVNNLRPGQQVSIDAVKSPTGQLTAQSVVIIPPKGGTVPPANPPLATDVTVTGDSDNTVMPAGATAARNRIVAVRSVKLGQEVGEVRVNGATVFRFRGVRSAEPYTRAQIVASRLNGAAMANLRPDEVGVRRVNGEYVVTARGANLITADSITARINRTTPVALAAQWANNLRRQLASAG